MSERQAWMPTRGRVAIKFPKPKEDEEGLVQSEGGIYLPGKLAAAAIGKGREIEDPDIGTVVAVGARQLVGGEWVESEFSVGEVVKARRIYGTPVEADDESEIRVFLWNEITAVRTS